jgi:hypothetical protein
MRYHNANGELDATVRTRTFAEELASALSAMDCVLNGEKAIYASSELTTGRRLYELMREVGVRDRRELHRKLGEAEWKRCLWDPNLAEALELARKVRARSGGALVLTPGPYAASGWSQPEYLTLWETVVRTRIGRVVFGRDWQYSNGCAFEFAVATDAGLPVFDEDGTPISLEQGRALIAAASAEIEAEGFDAAELRHCLARLP